MLSNPPHWRLGWRKTYTDVAMALASLNIPVLILLEILNRNAPPVVAVYTTMDRKWQALALVQQALYKSQYWLSIQ
jgi:hypothetical protein